MWNLRNPLQLQKLHHQSELVTMRTVEGFGIVAQPSSPQWAGRRMLGWLLGIGLGSLAGVVQAQLSVETTVVELDALEDRVSGYSVLLSNAEKTGRELLVKNELIVSGERMRKLWQWPRGASETDVFAELAQQLQGTVLFDCEGPDCGRSNVWSTLVFGEALIYGPSQYQHYRAVRDEAGNVHLLYVVRRGNRRVHALYEQITDVEVKNATEVSRPRVVAALAENGIARLAAVPGVDGSLSAETRVQLEEVGSMLAGFAAGEVYAVCHLYRSGLPRTVGESRKERGATGVEASTAESAAVSALQAGFASAAVAGIAEDSKNRKPPESVVFKSFGVGPLQPTLGTGNRIELVVPSRLLRE